MRARPQLMMVSKRFITLLRKPSSAAEVNRFNVLQHLWIVSPVRSGDCHICNPTRAVKMENVPTVGAGRLTP